MKFFSHTKLKAISVVLFFGLMLMGLKFWTYWITGSQAILTDAIESIINIVGNLLALMSLYFSLQPRDIKHPYGHGKLEYVSAGIEGALISVAGVYIVWEGISGIIHPKPISAIGWGLALTTLSGLLNGAMGWFLLRYGKKHHSPIMNAEGKHLLTDALSSIGLLGGLVAIHFTGILWLDGLLALLLGVYIVVVGFKMLKQSVGVLIDEADYKTLAEVVTILNENRAPRWIDIHNLRVQKFGANLHIDCHLTLPWFSTLEQSHAQASSLEKLLKKELGEQTELFVHTDPCIPPSSCSICPVADCSVRRNPQERHETWTLDNLLPNIKHRV
jgi:cation diffusion facilitator family transporter